MSFASFNADLDSVTPSFLFSAGGYEQVRESVRISGSGNGLSVCSMELSFITRSV